MIYPISPQDSSSKKLWVITVLIPKTVGALNELISVKVLRIMPGAMLICLY